MKSVLKMIFLLGLMTVLLTACNEEANPGQQEQKQPPTNQEEPVNKGETNPKQDPKEDKEKGLKDVSFREAFPPNEVLNDPRAFVQSVVVPRFSLGLTKQEIEGILGRPDLIRKGNEEYGELSDWVYDDVNGYRLVITFNLDQQIMDFKLNRYFANKGLIPKVTNKHTPETASPVQHEELGFEELLLGAKLEEILNNYGEPSMAYISYDQMYGYDLSLVYKGVTLHVLLESEKPYVHFIETNNYGTVETYRGIKVGSTVDEVIEQYGTPTYDWKETGDLIYATPDMWFAIKFEMKEEKVENINIYEAS